MPVEDDDSDFDLDLDFDLAAEPETSPTQPAPAPAAADPPPPAPEREVEDSPGAEPAPASIRKRLPETPEELPPAAENRPTPPTLPPRRTPIQTPPPPVEEADEQAEADIIPLEDASAADEAEPPQPSSAETVVEENESAAESHPHLPPRRPADQHARDQEARRGLHAPPPPPPQALPELNEPPESPAEPEPERPETSPARKHESPAGDPFEHPRPEELEVGRRQNRRRPKQEQNRRRTGTSRDDSPLASPDQEASPWKQRLVILVPAVLLAAVLLFVADKIFGDRDPDKPDWNVDEIQNGGTPPNDPDKDQPPAITVVPDPGQEEPPPPIDRSNETPEDRDERAETLLRDFFNVTKKEELLPFIRDPERVAPLIKEFYSREPEILVFDFLGLKSDLQEYETPGPNFYAAEADLGGPSSRTVILEDTPQGFRVDWEYFVQYNPMNWETFTKEAPSPPAVEPMDFRVLARIVPDYRAPFSDESRYLAIQMITLDPASSELIGYAVRDSDLGRRLEEFLAEKPDDICILRLEFPGGATPGDTAVHIRELVNPHWIITDETSGN